MTLRHPLTQRTRKSALPQRRKKKLPYRIFQAMKAQNGWMLEERDDVET
jgi:hypothetical protein